MKLPKKLIIPIVVFAAIGVLTGAAIQSDKIISVFSLSKPPVIILDPGHGSPDGGAVGVSGTVEKDVNLAIAKITGEVLGVHGYTVIYTRTDDNGIYSDDAKTIREMKVSDMHRRRDIMEQSNADLFISIHMNSFENSSPNGLHIFYSAQHEEIRSLAEKLQDKMSFVTGAEAHTVKTVSQDLFLMKNPPLPCILAECGFLSNPNEEKLLSDSTYQSKIGWAIADSVFEYFDF